MARQTNKDMRGQGGRGRGRGGWSSRPVLLDLGSPERTTTTADRDSPTARRAHALANNTYVRRIEGFGGRATELLLASGLAYVGREGQDGLEICFVPVTFSGISQKPTKEIEYGRPGIAVTRSGLMVLSGVVAKPDQAEIGTGESAIRQVDAPNLDSHCSPARLNVALGTSDRVTHSELSAALRGSTLALTQVVMINGEPILPYHGSEQIEQKWDRLAPQPPVRRSSTGYYDVYCGPY